MTLKISIFLIFCQLGLSKYILRYISYCSLSSRHTYKVASKPLTSWIAPSKFDIYPTGLQAREEKSAQFFDLDEVDPLTEALDQQWSEKNQMLLQDNNRFVQQREQEINAIVQNIGQLNTIFKDLAQVCTSFLYISRFRFF